MVAKGHDFPNATVLAVLDADALLSFPDFRSAERTFQLVTQAAGRVGRGEKPGVVAVQTARPDHEAIAAAVAQDHPRFAEGELRFRRAFAYPPFSHLLLALWTAKELPEAEAARPGRACGDRPPAPAPPLRARTGAAGAAEGALPRPAPDQVRLARGARRGGREAPGARRSPRASTATRRASCDGRPRPVWYIPGVSADNRFEEPLERLRTRIDGLRQSPESPARDKAIRKLSDRLEKLSGEIYANLTPWQKTLVARHPARPFTLDYVRVLLRDFVELHGDRAFADDPAIVAGFGFLGERTVAVVGHQKGRDTKEKIRRNFGMPRPEGYRKALRVMKLAEKFRRPVLTFIDTPGAYPGIDSEERGVSEAIADEPPRDVAPRRSPSSRR